MEKVTQDYLLSFSLSHIDVLKTLFKICSLKILLKKNRQEGIMNPQRTSFWGFSGGSVVKNPPADAGDTCSIPGPEGSQVPRSK